MRKYGRKKSELWIGNFSNQYYYQYLPIAPNFFSSSDDFFFLSQISQNLGNARVIDYFYFCMLYTV